jgi:hypothetical protein
MTVDYTYSAAYDVISYIWDGLTSKNILNPSLYIVSTGPSTSYPVVPIIPVQEVPEVANHLGSNLYMVYEYSMLGQSIADIDNWMISRDEIVFSIYSQDQLKIMEIINFFSDTFRRADLSAHDINLFSGITGKFHFYTTNLISSAAAVPVDSEGGRMIGEVIIGYDYARVIDSAGRFI